MWRKTVYGDGRTCGPFLTLNLQYLMSEINAICLGPIKFNYSWKCLPLAYISISRHKMSLYYQYRLAKPNMYFKIPNEA
jgi:hypothetical protein